MKRFLFALVVMLAPSLAWAGAGTITVLDSTGATKTYDVVTDGSGNFVAKAVLCDQSAAANCAGVDANNSLQAHLFQGTSAISTTNGLYSNLLQGNAVISATNGLFSNLLQGNAVISATNGLYSNLLQGNAALTTSNGLPATIVAGGNTAAVDANSSLQAHLFQGTAALSATNGLFSNLLQGNAVISATNGLYSNLLQGNAVISATNGLFSNVLQGNAVLSATNGLPSSVVAGGNTAAVKAASTAAGATDPALVVAVSPNNTIPVNLTTCAAGICNTNGQAVMANSAPVVIASNQTAVASSVTTWATGTLGAMANYGTSPGAVLVPGVNAFMTNANANGQAAMASSAPVTIASNQALADKCTWKLKSYAPVSITSSAKIITGTTALKTYICSFHIVTATAQNIALVEGTGTVCATNIYGLAGGTTAATGWNFAANSGIARGDGNATVLYGSGDANATAADVCLLLSGSGQTSGVIAYVQE